MTWLGSRLSSGVGRMALGVLATAAAAGAARARRGGDTRESTPMMRSPRPGRPPAATAGPLGPKDGDVYPVGDGFGQNFAAARSSSPPTPVRTSCTGAILDKYQSLGGPADSDLGFPTIDEGPAGSARTAATPRSARPTSRSSSGRRTPVPGWCAVPINAAWDKLGGSAGALGVPDRATRRTTATSSPRSSPAAQVSYDTRHQGVHHRCRPTWPASSPVSRCPSMRRSAINAAWRAAGGLPGPLGAAAGRPVRRSAPTAPGRTSPAARSSTARPPAPTS